MVRTVPDRFGLLVHFRFYTSPHRVDPRRDEDLAAYAVVAALEESFGTPYPEMPWEPELVFDAIAATYG